MTSSVNNQGGLYHPGNAGVKNALSLLPYRIPSYPTLSCYSNKPRASSALLGAPPRDLLFRPSDCVISPRPPPDLPSPPSLSLSLSLRPSFPPLFQNDKRMLKASKPRRQRRDATQRQTEGGRGRQSIHPGYERTNEGVGIWVP